MGKKLENMTTDERIAYWAAQREKERIQRRNRIAKLSLDQRVAVIKDRLRNEFNLDIREHG